MERDRFIETLFDTLMTRSRSSDIPREAPLGTATPFSPGHP
ncbi:hypothetical protein AVEN_177696-1, partial [Araneus ventricosus]